MKLNRIGPSGRYVRLAVVALGLLVASAKGASAQGTDSAGEGSAWLPPEVYFAPTLAAPDEPRFSLSFISSDVLARPAGSPGRPPLPLSGDQEFQAIAAFGGMLRFWRPATWEGGGLVTGLQTGVFGRFLMAESASPWRPPGFPRSPRGSRASAARWSRGNRPISSRRCV